MLSPRWRKIARDLWSNKTRTLLVILSIAVGVFAVGMIASSQEILAEELSSTYRQTRPASATLYGSFDDEVVEAVRRMDGVADAEGRNGISVRLQLGPTEWRDLRLTAVPDFQEIRLSQFSPVSGAWPPADREILIDRASVEVAAMAVGDRARLELPDGKVREVRVAGTAHDLNQPSALFNPTLQGFVTFDTLEWLGGSRDYDELHILVADRATDRDHIQAVADGVKERLERGGRTVAWVWVPTPGEHWADDIIEPLLMILGVLGFLSMALSGFLVINTISALITQQIRQIGVMKAIGARTGQLAGMYLGAVVIFAALSLLVAVPLGALGASGLVNFTARMLNFPEIGLRIPPRALLLEIAVGLMVPLLAALVPIASGTRITVREAISAHGMGKGQFGASAFDRLLERVRGLPRPLLLSLRNTFRRKARLLLTLSTLTLGGAIFVAVLSVHTSLMATLDAAMAYWHYDVDVDLARPYRTDVLAREALAVPGVEAVEGWGVTGARRVRPDGSDGQSFALFAPPADTEMLRPTVLEGRWLLPDDENAIVVNSTLLRDEPDIGVGDEIELTIEGRDTRWRVVGVVQGVMTGPLAYSNYPYFAEIVRTVGRVSTLRVVTTDHDADFQAQMATALQAHFEAAGLNVGGTDTIEAVRQNAINQFNVLVAFLTIMAVLIAVVGGLGLMGTMSINVLERSREIGVMRAIGASDGSVLQIFLVEGVLIGGFSWVVGSLLAVPISQLLSNVVGVAFVDAPLLYTFSTSGALGWLAIVLTLAALASFLPAWRASRLTVRDVLAYE